MCLNSNKYLFYTANHLDDIMNASTSMDLDDELIEYLLKLFGADNIPSLSPILLNWLQRQFESKNKLIKDNSFKSTSSANLKNFSLAKTNVFLQNIKSLKKSKADLETLKRYSNLVLSTQQATEENHIEHSTEMIKTVTDVQHSGDLLLYVSERDNKVRADHKSADGTVLPKSDPFWNVAMNLLSDFNCRCSVIQAPRGYAMKPGPHLVLKELQSPSNIHLEEGKAILFKETLPVFQDAEPIVRRQFKKVGF